ncbi:MAG: glucose-1-phosphate cytidylyltransferase [Clostridia bacterium]
MKVVILAGGYGTRISEESVFRPKPMVEIGGMPILWHIMKTYSHYGFNDFVICAGYKQHVIKEWFADYFLHTSDVTFDFTEGNKVVVHNRKAEPWKVTVIDTGLDTKTGGRVKRIKDYVKDETFMLTYGDGVCDIDISKLLDFHKSHGCIATISAVTMEQRFGILGIDNDNSIYSFREKTAYEAARINGGYMVLSPGVFDYITDDNSIFEEETLPALSSAGQLKAYIHNGFWKPMDSKKEHDALENMWNSGKAPWKVWE